MPGRAIFRENLPDGGRKVSNAVICGAIASAMATHFATKSNDGVDIVIM